MIKFLLFLASAYVAVNVLIFGSMFLIMMWLLGEHPEWTFVNCWIAKWSDALSFIVGCGPLVTVDLHRMPRTSKPSYLIQHFLFCTLHFAGGHCFWIICVSYKCTRFPFIYTTPLFSVITLWHSYLNFFLGIFSWQSFFHTLYYNKDWKRNAYVYINQMGCLHCCFLCCGVCWLHDISV